jgi:hypothetical protein
VTREKHPLAGKTVVLKCQDFHHLLDENYKKIMQDTIQMHAPDLNGFLFKVHDWVMEDGEEYRKLLSNPEFFYATNGYHIRRGFFIKNYIGIPPEEKNKDVVIGKLLENDKLFCVHNSELGEVVSEEKE